MEVSLAIPLGSVDYWVERLVEQVPYFAGILCSGSAFGL
jgi:hypothetical protein